MHIVAVPVDGMSVAQSQFAFEHTAIPVTRSERDRRLIFMYHSDERRTFRWLVDETGGVVDSASFRCSPVTD